VTKEKEKTQAELENEKIRDMMDNYDSLSPTDQNFLGRLILSRFSREENMSRFFKLHVTGEEFDVNNIFDPDDLVLSHVTEEDFGLFLHTLLKRNFKNHHFYSHLFWFTFSKYHVDLGYDTRKRLVYVYKYPDAAVKIWTDKMKFGCKLTDEEIDKIFAYADAANNDNLIESLDKYF
jgi:hypothetical protein